MASDNLTAMEMLRPTFADNWIADMYTKENDTLTKAIQKSISTTSCEGDAFSAEMLESLLAKPAFAAPLYTPTAPENDAPVSKQRPSGRIAKRKSKLANTTFIAADPSNFRQMVQQVTGVRFGGLNGMQVLKPEPQRASSMPTLDKAALFMDGSTAGNGRTSNLETFCSFPTLESWKVM